MSEDSKSAAMLSAIRENSPENMMPVNLAPTETYEDDEEDLESEDSCPISPSSESQETGELQEGGSGEDCFKMYTCKFCGKKFSEPRSLRHHVIRFHSDGSLRHRIKRDRRKKGVGDSPTPSMSPVPSKSPECHFKDVLKETENQLITTSSSSMDMTACLSGQTHGSEMYLTAANLGNHDEGKEEIDESRSPLALSGASEVSKEQGPPSIDTAVTTSAEVTSCDTTTTYTTNLTRIIMASLDTPTRVSRPHPSFLDSFRNDEVEPGESRLHCRTKIMDDGKSGHRLVITDDQSDEGRDHSPHV